MRDRPALLLHCQHSLGLGHLVRSFALAEALSEQFRVTVLCGGELPDAIRRPAGVDVVELFPFGRKKLAGELVPLLEASRAAGAVTAASVRDLLVEREDGGRHDERASTT